MENTGLAGTHTAYQQLSEEWEPFNVVIARSQFESWFP